VSAAARTAAPARVGPMLAVGMVGGVFSGLLGVGGGIVMVPLLVLILGQGQRAAHAISLAAIIPIAVVGAVTYLEAGMVDLGAALALALGSIVGARYGAKALSRIDEGWLKVVFGVFLVGVSVSVAVTA
jgi:uncharacterized protein